MKSIIYSSFIFTLFCFTSAFANQVDGGMKYTCALDDNGVKCWGSNQNGETSIPPLKNPKMISVGQDHACALDIDGVKCWGDNRLGALNSPALKNPKTVVAGRDHTCTIDDNVVRCWGYNSYGQISVPALKNPRALSAGDTHTCAIDDNGVKCWGSNSFRQLDVPKLRNPRAILSKTYHTCALDDDGMKCWGGNRDGQTNVPELKNPRAMSVGYEHTCALDDNGVKCWGINTSGQLNVPALKNPRAIGAGRDHNCALDDDGIKCWGSNSDGQLNAPALKFGPQLESPRFKISEVPAYLSVLAMGSTPVRNKLFTTLSDFAKNQLKAQGQTSYERMKFEISNYFLISLLSPAILSGDSPFYIEKVIPSFNDSLSKAATQVGFTDLSKIPADLSVVRLTALKTMQTSLSLIHEFLGKEDRTKIQHITPLIGKAMAAADSRQDILHVLNAIRDQQAVFEKLQDSSKSSFLVETLFTTSEWLDKKIR